MHPFKYYLIGTLLCSQVLAQDIKLTGTLDYSLQTPQNTSINTKPFQQDIKLLKVELSEAAVNELTNRAASKNHKTSLLTQSNTLVTAVQLGMNNVPVLNQGMFGTCVTFAATAALDAALGKGDYISQLCQLQLGLNFEKNGFSPSGWDGTWGRYVLSQIDHFGIINKAQQKAQGCGGLTEYPDSEQPGPDRAMSLEQFHQMGESLLQDSNVTWTPILDFLHALSDRVDTNETLKEVKTALNEGERVTFAVLLVDTDLGLAGAVGKRHAPYDSWVLTPEILRDIYLKPEFAGHEMIITGYDDEAVAVDDKGREYKGLLTLRNSWGNRFGDQGDFYMSYDYFKILVVEAQRIRSFSEVQIAKQ